MLSKCEKCGEIIMEPKQLIKNIKQWKDEWEMWRNWLKILALNDVFIDVFNDNKELYDSSFISEIQRIIDEVAKK